ncbi:hypothetical protein CSKR_110142 [Clonorchis sinensis]|uniref:Uncharacterized protein n=1 Tax=Clonorchis sinensis TaxID=79923 RepID=A0A3R7GJS7_CLOSI|nr:hypothetical protein CSKR_110142 [Clonorchis sinensis]
MGSVLRLDNVVSRYLEYLTNGNMRQPGAAHSISFVSLPVTLSGINHSGLFLDGVWAQKSVTAVCISQKLCDLLPCSIDVFHLKEKAGTNAVEFSGNGYQDRYQVIV